MNTKQLMIQLNAKADAMARLTQEIRDERSKPPALPTLPEAGLCLSMQETKDDERTDRLSSEQ